MKFIASLLVTAFLANGLWGYEVPTQADIARITEDLEKVFYDNRNGRGIMILIPKAIRLAFHDCIEGCDGCINIEQEENLDLRRVVNNIEPVYQQYKDVLSRADFWALTAHFAVKMGVMRNNEIFCKYSRDPNCQTPDFNMELRFGRQDCGDGPYTTQVENDLPDPRMGTEDVAEWFDKNFGISANDGAAVIGLGHNLGSAHYWLSPYSGSWEPNNKDGISNKYFVNLVNERLGWHLVDASKYTGRDVSAYQWEAGRGRNNKAFAFTSDMALYKEYEVDPITGKPSCEYNQCPIAEDTAATLRKYAEDKQAWVDNASRVYESVLEYGYDNLQSPKA